MNEINKVERVKIIALIVNNHISREVYPINMKSARGLIRDHKEIVLITYTVCSDDEDNWITRGSYFEGKLVNQCNYT